MTNSQIKAIVAAIVAALAVLDGKMELLTAVLPQKYAEWLRVAVAVGGVLVVLFNQSASPNHVSIPVETAKAAGVAPEQTK